MLGTVGKQATDGTIDWVVRAQVDSPSIFAGLLGGDDDQLSDRA